MPVSGMRSSEILWFPDSNSKMFCPINLKRNRVSGHHQGLDAFEVGVSLFAHFRHAVIRNILVSGLQLEDA